MFYCPLSLYVDEGTNLFLTGCPKIDPQHCFMIILSTTIRNYDANIFTTMLPLLILCRFHSFQFAHFSNFLVVGAGNFIYVKF